MRTFYSKVGSIAVVLYVLLCLWGWWDSAYCSGSLGCAVPLMLSVLPAIEFNYLSNPSFTMTNTGNTALGGNSGILALQLLHGVALYLIILGIEYLIRLNKKDNQLN